MKFKIDENLPIEFVELLHAANQDAVTVGAQRLSGETDSKLAELCQREARIMVTLDLDFADIRVYPPKRFPGFIVLRVARQDKSHLINAFQNAVHLLGREPLEHRLWIVEENRVRIRGEE